MKLRNFLLCAFIFCFLSIYAQNGKECIDEILKLEEKNTVNTAKDKESDKTTYVNYSVKTTDWENQVTVSNVRVYKGKDNTHFFSEQATIYQDEQDVFLILPIQKLVIINSTKKELYDKQPSDEFFQLRRGFLDSCEVVRCELSKQDSTLKTLELKVKYNLDGSVKITKMQYEYNLKTDKIERTKITYNSEYKVKEILVSFKESTTQSDYKFNSAHKYVLDKNHKLLAKYKGYELLDNRK